MGQELAIPAWANEPVTGAFAALNQLNQGQSLSDGIGRGYPVVYFRGKNWSIGYRGERKTVLRPDDGTPAGYLDVIILGSAGHKSKSFYPKWDPNNQDSGERPICSSMDGVVPDQDVQQKQADACALCPRNVWKQEANGRKGRECSDGKRLAVFVLPQQTQVLFGQAIHEPAFLRVPAASLNSLAIMGDMMQSRGRYFTTYVTRITFDPQESHPKMVFTPILKLDDTHAPGILKLVQDPQVERIIHGGFVERVPPQPGSTLVPPPSQLQITQGAQVGQGAPNLTGTAPAPNLTGIPLSTGAPSPTTPSLQTNGSPMAGASIATTVAPPATPTGPTTTATTPAPISTAPLTSAPPPQVDLTGLTGFGTVQPASPPPASPAPVGQQASAVQQVAAPSTVISDVGAPEAADEDLDTKIAARLAAAKQ